MSTTWQWAKANPDAAARRIRELERENGDHGLTIVTIKDIVTNDKHSDKAKVLAIQYVLRKETHP